MQTTIKQRVTVQKGGLIEVRSPELLEGAEAEVIITLETLPVDVSDAWSDEDLRDFTRSGEQLISWRLEEATT